jgi:sec-independent protein translocase protein TatB
MFGLTFDKLALIAIIAVVILGPERLPLYAGRLAELIRGLRDLTDTAKSRLKQELGPDADDIDWKKLDPRQYDPRRIIREALADDEVVVAPAESAVASVGTAVKPVGVPRAGSDGRYRRPPVAVAERVDDQESVSDIHQS